LRAWPVNGMTGHSLACLHQLMKQARGSGLHFVPLIHPTEDGATWLERSCRLWELSSWQPGRADFHSNPSPQRIHAASTALAHVHMAWSQFSKGCGVCPAVLRRLARFQEWSELIASGWRGPLDAPTDATVYLISYRAWTILARHIHRVPALLQPWTTRALPLQPCLCDVWHDHLLFDGDALTGLIDFGAVKPDHVAVDLARMLGSLVGDDWEA